MPRYIQYIIDVIRNICSVISYHTHYLHTLCVIVVKNDKS
jgi:hypothetical protein